MSDLPSTEAVARRGDPQTSWLAAHSLDEDTLRDSQLEVLEFMVGLPPITDEDRYYAQISHGIVMSRSGSRTRRKELVDFGLVRDSGYRRVLESGRLGIMWEYADVETPLEKQLRLKRLKRWTLKGEEQKRMDRILARYGIRCLVDA